METKTCTKCKIKKVSTIFTKNIQNIKIVIVSEAQKVTMIMKIVFQFNKRYLMKEVEKNLYYRNKTIDIYNSKTLIDPMLN